MERGRGVLCPVPMAGPLMYYLTPRCMEVLKPPPLQRRTPGLRVSNLPRVTQARSGRSRNLLGCVELQRPFQDITEI